MTATVVIANQGTPYEDARVEQSVLSAYDVDIVFTSNSPLEEFLDAAAGARAIINPPHPTERELFEQLGDLEVVATPSVGFNHIDIDAATDHGVFVVNTPGYCAEEVAVHAFALLLSCHRDIVGYDRELKTTGQTIRRGLEPPRRLRNLTLGLAAFGAIAQQLAEIAAGFGMNVITYDPYVPPEKITEAGVEPVEFDELLSRSDVISIHTPLTAETQGLFGADAFEAMNDDAILINTSRGEVVQQGELYEALTTGELAAAGLDVLEEEPPRELALADLENVVLTPHGGAYSEEAHEEARRRAAEDVVRVLAGQVPEGLVNKVAGQ